jgi:hypothetical protein
MNSASAAVRKYGLWVVVPLIFWAWILSWWVHRDEIVFRTSELWIDGEFKKSSNTSAWRLRLPKDLYIRRDSYYDTIHVPGRTTKPWWWLGSGFADGGSFLYLSMGILPSGEIVPIGKKSEETTSSFTLRLSNFMSEHISSQEDICVTEDAYVQQFKPKPVKSTCYGEVKFCKIFTSHLGWPITVSADRYDAYERPKEVCQLARQTLSSWTISIDDLRTPKQLVD